MLGSNDNRITISFACKLSELHARLSCARVKHMLDEARATLRARSLGEADA